MGTVSLYDVMLAARAWNGMETMKPGAHARKSGAHANAKSSNTCKQAIFGQRNNYNRALYLLIAYATTIEHMPRKDRLLDKN